MDVTLNIECAVLLWSETFLITISYKYLEKTSKVNNFEKFQ